MKEIDYEKFMRQAPIYKKTAPFKATNLPWAGENNCGNVNKQTMIGGTMALYRRSKATNCIEWMKFYFKTGEEYDKLSEEEQIAKAKEYGRSFEYLEKNVVPYFRSQIKEFEVKYDYTDRTLMMYTLIRTLYETWMGGSGEGRAHCYISTNFPMFYLKHTDSTEDSKYAVDFEVYSYKTNKLLFGIQVKPSTIQGNVMEQNLKNNLRYEKDKGVKVLYVIYQGKEILNKKEINYFCKQFENE